MDYFIYFLLLKKLKTLLINSKSINTDKPFYKLPKMTSYLFTLNILINPYQN